MIFVIRSLSIRDLTKILKCKSIDLRLKSLNLSNISKLNGFRIKMMIFKCELCKI